jgi:hypothetical protein
MLVKSVVFFTNALSKHIKWRSCLSILSLRNYSTYEYFDDIDTERYTVEYVVEIEVPFV